MDTRVHSGPRRLDDLPAPPGLPWLGNALQLKPQALHLILERWSRQYGPMFVVRLGSRRLVVCSDHELLQTVLRSRPDEYRRFKPIEKVLAEMGANGVFSAEGAAWLPQRKLIMRAMAPNHFRAFFPALQAITERLRQHWLRAAASGEPVEMTRDLMRYTVDVTTTLAFGEDPNTIEQTGDVIQQHLALIFPAIMARFNTPFPYWHYVKLPHDRRLERALQAVHRHVQGLIERTRRRMHDQPSDEPRNALEAMLAARDEPGSGITDDVVVANVLTLLLAGEDTTANTLAWTIFHLSTHADKQQALQAEAQRQLGAVPVCKGFEDLKNLDYFEAVAHEATRFHPVIPLLSMENLHDTVLGDLALPAGTPLFFLLRPAMQDAGNFGAPDQFLPQRWLPGHEQVQPHEGHAYVQFGAGPRVCPGRHLAGVELRLVLSMLARNFEVELACEPSRIHEVMAFTMTPNSVPVRLRRRAA